MNGFTGSLQGHNLLHEQQPRGTEGWAVLHRSCQEQPVAQKENGLNLDELQHSENMMHKVNHECILPLGLL